MLELLYNVCVYDNGRSAVKESQSEKTLLLQFKGQSGEKHMRMMWCDSGTLRTRRRNLYGLHIHCPLLHRFYSLSLKDSSGTCLKPASSFFIRDSSTASIPWLYMVAYGWSVWHTFVARGVKSPSRTKDNISLELNEGSASFPSISKVVGNGRCKCAIKKYVSSHLSSQCFPRNIML